MSVEISCNTCVKSKIEIPATSGYMTCKHRGGFHNSEDAPCKEWKLSKVSIQREIYIQNEAKNNE